MAINFNGSYSQDFDTLATAGSSSILPADWLILETGTNANSTYTAGTGSSNTGDTYSFGASGSSERALGGLQSGSLIPSFGTSFTNNTGAAITSLTVSYQGEQWRLGSAGRADRLDFQYSLDATSLSAGTWLDVDSLDFSSSTTAIPLGVLDGNTNSGLINTTISGINIPAGATFWFRWQDFNASGADDGLAIDNFSIATGITPPPTAGVTITESNGGTQVNEQGETTNTYAIALNTTPTSAVTIAIAADSQTQISSDGVNFSSALNVVLNSTTPQTITVRAINDTNIETATHTGVITHTVTSSDASYSGLAVPNLNVSVLDNDVALMLTKINEIQGSGTAAAAGIFTIEGIVVGDFQGTNQLGGFYLQEEDTDADGSVLTSEGIFVNSLFAVNAGDRVQITGTVQENATTPSFNQAIITPSSTQILGSGFQSLVTATAVDLPTTTLGDLERYEGMLVTLPETLTVTETFNLGRFGEVVLSANGRLFNPTNFIDPNDNPASGTTASGTSNVAAVTAQQNLNNRSRIILDDGSSASNLIDVPYINTTDANPLNDTLRIGSTTTGVTGVLGFGFSAYRLQPTATPTFDYAARPDVPTVGGNVKVGSFNVLNYFNGDGGGGGFPTSRGADTAAEFSRQRDKIIAAIVQLNADVVGLIEIENDGDGPNSAIADLVNGLNAVAGAGTYAFTPLANTTGTAGTDQIKVAFIYKPSAVTPVGNAVYFNDPAFATARPPLAQTFGVNATGETFTSVINHFKSKSSAANLPGDADQGDGQGLSNATRVAQANALLNFVTQLQTTTGDSDVMVLGDLNAYTEEDPIDVLRAGGLTRLTTATDSFVFQGQTGSLDHALVTSSLLAQVTGAAKWNINADEPITLDYNDDVLTAGEAAAEDRNDTTLYAPTPFRSSDHDPVLVGLNLVPVNAAPTAIALTNTVTTLAENTSTTTRIKVADISVTDDGLGTNVLSLSGADASLFELDGTALFLKANTDLNVEVKPSYAVAVNVDDATIGSTPDASASFTLNLTNVNEAPVAANDAAVTSDLQSVVIAVLANDADVDANDPLAIASFTNPANGTVVQNANNTFTYTPTVGFAGVDSFTYTLQDIGSLTSTATVNITVTQGSNQITGTNGNDNLVGTNRADVIRALAGNDTINGGLEADTLVGGLGNDTYIVDAGDVLVENPSEGTDVVRASMSWTLAANVENLTLTGNGAIAGTGNELDNVLTGNSANNLLSGLGGNDTYIVNSSGDVVVENANEGIDLVRSAVTFTLTDHVENLTLTGSSSINGIGNSLDNSLTGNDGRNSLTGLDGNDILDGKTSNDTMTGGLGNDTYIVESAGDRTLENDNEGTDLVRSSRSWTLSHSVENLTLTGNDDINGTGNSLDNVLTGNGKSNTLKGSSGNDTLIGGNSDDTLTGGSSNDRFVYTALNEKGDRITDFNTTQDTLDLTVLFDYLGSTPVTSSFLRFTRSGSRALVQIDQNGTTGGANFTTLATLDNVNVNNLIIGSNVLV